MGDIDERHHKVMQHLNTEGSADEFEALVEEHQSSLRGFIMSLVGDPNQAADVLQETNLVLWRKAADFELGTNFGAWSRRVAHFQVLAHRQRAARDRLVFSDAFVEMAADEQDDEEPVSPQISSGRLRYCLAKLPERQRDAISLHYLHGRPVTKIAGELGMQANAVYQLLFRARKNLHRCLSSR